MSAVATVAINVDARDATGQLRQLQGQSQATQQAISGISASAARSTAATSSLVSSIQRLTGAYLGLRTAQEAFQTGIQRTESERRLTFLAKGYGEVAAAQEAAARAGRQFGLSTTESNQQFAQLYGRLRPLNVTLTDIESAFVGFNTAAKVSGSTAAESAGALLQLTQALGSGVLRGQELNSVLEQAPGLVVALTRELGVPITQIRKLADEGKITSDVVIRALKRAGDEGAGQLAEAMKGPAQAVKNLQNEFENFQVAATEELIPALTDALKGLRDLLESLGPVIKGLGGIAAQTFGTVADLVNAITKPKATAAAIAIRGGRLPMAGFGGISGAGELFAGTSGAGGVGLTGLKAEAEQLARLRRQPVTKVLLELMRNRLARVETPAVPTRTAAQTGLQVGAVVSGGGTGGGGKGRTGKTDAEKAADAIKQSFQNGIKLGIELNRQLKLENAANEYAKERLQIQFTYRDRLMQIGELKDKDQKLALQDLAIKLRDLDLQKLITKEYAEQNRLFYERAGFTPGAPLGPGAGAFRTDINLNPLAGTDPIAEYAQRLRDLMDPINQAKAGADAIGTAFNDAFSGLITGTQTAQEALGNFFKGISDSFLQMATQMIAEMIKLYVFKSLLGLFGGGGAAGGLFSGAGPVSGASVFGAGQAGFNPLSFGAGVALRAMGGPVTAGQPYMVGERGPELFVPSGGGSIVPNGKAGGGGVAVTVNVDAKSTSVEGSNQQAGQLGRVIAAAVQAELVNQKRRGGLLNS